MREALPREEVIKAIEHKSPKRVPMMIHQWNWASAFGDRTEEVQAILDQYPSDAAFGGPRMPGTWENPDDPDHIPGYCWMNRTARGSRPRSPTLGNSDSAAWRPAVRPVFSVCLALSSFRCSMFSNALAA